MRHGTPATRRVSTVATSVVMVAVAGRAGGHLLVVVGGAGAEADRIKCRAFLRGATVTGPRRISWTHTRAAAAFPCT
jgi:hypothetical protein